MTVALTPVPEFRSWDNNGNPLVGGQLFTYVAGTSTPQATYIDSTQTTQNTNPVILNFRGEASVWLVNGQTYKLVLQDSLGNLIWSQDQVAGGVTLAQVLAFLTANVVGGIIWPLTSAESAASVTPTTFAFPPGDIRRYGAVLDGVTNDAAAWQSAVNVVCGTSGSGPGGTIYAPTGTSVINTTITWPRNFYQVDVMGYGCRITSTSALGFNFVWVMSTGQNQNGVNVYGLTFDHLAIASSQGLIDMAFALNTHFYDCSFLGATTGSFVIARCRNSTVGNDNTGCFWTRFQNCIFYYAATGYYGLILRGAANATSVVGCVFTNCGIAGVYMQQDSGQTTMPNAVLIEGCAFETFATYAIAAVISTSTTGIAGLRCIGNRFENGGTAFAFTGTISGASAVPAYLAGNYLISNVTYLLNSSGDTINSFDFSTTPAINPSMNAPADITWTSTAGNIASRFGATGKGYSIQNTSGTEQGAFRFKAGGGVALVGSASGPLTISATATAANNLRGSGSTAAAGTSTVTFGTAEPDTSYFLTVTLTSGTGTISSIAKNTGTFVITWSAAVTNTYDWHLIR